MGIGPKKFANIVRFQHAIQLRKSGLDYFDIMAGCHFSDQAHFTHDFKRLAGCSPEQFFRETLQPELAAQYNEIKADSPVSHTMYQ
ncbi:helix-turn-helix domain-containing protein [Paenibacillus hexagrammi]|uniref:helix-turn-helix domain-containing protein n=1 Tax=Paenibacillus hexagrammi TaxID=2908839 RepID=UPI003312FEDC